MILNADQAAGLLHCTADTVRRLAAAGTIPGRKLGRRWLFDPDQLRAYVRGEWQPAPKRSDPKPTRRSERKPLTQEARARRVSDRKRCYRQRNRGLIASYAAKRKAAELRAMPPWVSRADIERVYAEAAAATDLTGIPHHVDHIVPLQARNVCGLHVPWNLRVIPAAENISRPRDYRGELCF